MTLISVIVPCFNQSQYLDDCINSIVNQTYDNWECIIVDDGSTDDTSKIAEKWTTKEKCVSYIYQENQGLSAARNTGLSKVSGSYIQFLDADDFLDVKKFEISIQIMQQFKVDLVLTDFFVYEDKTYQTKPAYCDLSQVDFNLKSIVLDWDRKFSIPIHCALISKNLLRGFRFPNELQAKEDWIMWISIFKKKCITSFVDLPLVYYRSHSDNMCLDRSFMENQKQKALAYIQRLLPFKEYCLFILKPKFFLNYIYPLKRSLYSRLFKLKRILHFGL